MIEECELKQEEIAQRIGKNRTTVTNYLRLLKLPDELQLALRDRKISMGHARCLINVAEKQKQLEILYAILENDLSVRETEDLVKQNKVKTGSDQKKKLREKPVLTKLHQNYAEKLTDAYQTTVKIKPGKGGRGQIMINFTSEKELIRIASIIEREQ